MLRRPCWTVRGIYPVAASKAMRRGFEVYHSSVHCWVVMLGPLFKSAFRKHTRLVRKRQTKTENKAYPSSADVKFSLV